MSGVRVSSRSAIIPLKPLNTDKTQIMAAVATAIPHTETAEIAPTALCDFLVIRYRQAILAGKNRVIGWRREGGQYCRYNLKNHRDKTVNQDTYAGSVLQPEQVRNERFLIVVVYL